MFQGDSASKIWWSAGTCRNSTEYFNMDHADNGTWWAVPSAYDNKKNRKKYEENIGNRIDWMWLGGSI